MSTDRNDPETVAWLDFCRSQRRELSADEFEAMVPEFIAVANDLLAARAARAAH
jgi:hypothetical protein